MRSDHRHLTAHQIGCEVGQSFLLVLRPAILDLDILALDVPGFMNALPEGGRIACTIGGRPEAAEEAYHRHRRLLRPRRERPRHCAAEQRDELASFHSITSSARAMKVGGMVRPRAAAALRLMISSNSVASWTGRAAGFTPFRMRAA